MTLTPVFFLYARIGISSPPAITHPEYYYGFLCVAFAWQIAFLLIARDSSRHRPVMLAAILEKLSFGLFSVGLFAAGRSDAGQLFFAGVDLILGVLFIIAFRKAREIVAAA